MRLAAEQQQLAEVNTITTARLRPSLGYTAVGALEESGAGEHRLLAPVADQPRHARHAEIPLTRAVCER